jgi:hypothetical protein
MTRVKKEERRKLNDCKPTDLLDYTLQSSLWFYRNSIMDVYRLDVISSGLSNTESEKSATADKTEHGNTRRYTRCNAISGF